MYAWMSTSEPTLANLVVTKPSMLNVETELPTTSLSFGAEIFPTTGCTIIHKNRIVTAIALRAMPTAWKTTTYLLWGVDNILNYDFETPKSSLPSFVNAPQP